MEQLERREMMAVNPSFGPELQWLDSFSDEGEIRLVGDFNGDGKDDLATFTRSDTADVYVALSSGQGFRSAAVKWHEAFCYGDEIPLVGDFNGDRKDDIAAFTRGDTGDVYVALSTGKGFRTAKMKWHDAFCYGDEIPLVGNFNGDRKDDIAVFTRGNTGDVYVALSTGKGFRSSAVKWHDTFCYGSEVPLVGDFNGDRKDDIVTFPRGHTGDVYVALSTGREFSGSGWKWHDTFCYGDEIPLAGDFNGDGRDDIATFTRGSSADVYVALSTGRGFSGSGWKWHDEFCSGSDLPALGDFNADGKVDLARFTRGGTGDVFVALGTTKYMLHENWGGSWSDADKSKKNRDDDMLCWAASAANLLQWTHWGNVHGMTTADQMFTYLQQHWTDDGGSPYYALQWWFGGTNMAQGVSGWAQVDVAGGGFFPGQSLWNFIHRSSDRAQALSTIDSYLRSGYAVSLRVSTGAVNSGHFVTCWGYEFRAGNTGDYAGVYLTDSDDNTGSPKKDFLKYYEVVQTNGQWYLKKQGSGTLWTITDVYGLSERSVGGDAAGGLRAAESAAPVLPTAWEDASSEVPDPTAQDLPWGGATNARTLADGAEESRSFVGGVDAVMHQLTETAWMAPARTEIAAIASSASACRRRSPSDNWYLPMDDVAHDEQLAWHGLALAAETEWARPWI